jgi:hypothetical protein
MIACLVSLVISVLALVSHTFDAIDWIAPVADSLLTAVYGGYLLF